MAKKASEVARFKGKELQAVRPGLLIFLLLAPIAVATGCATQDRAARATEEAAVAESEDDAACQKKGAPDSEAYEACRKESADARARAAAAQEERRRDFDRTLGAGTEGVGTY